MQRVGLKTLRQSLWRLLVGAGRLAAFFLLPAMAFGGDYTFINIASNNGPLENFLLNATFSSHPEINNNGTVVFRAMRMPAALASTPATAGHLSPSSIRAGTLGR